MKFRKKPVVVEAWPIDVLTNTPFSDPELPQAIRDAANAGIYIHLGQGKAEIVTLEGTMRATSGDWIIQGVSGELYPCKSDIFYATYEPVEKEESQTQDSDSIKAESSEPLSPFEKIQADLQETLREIVRRTSILRQVFDPRAITASELDRQLDGGPTIIIEKPLKVEAASITLDGKKIRTFLGPRYPVNFEKICSDIPSEQYYDGLTEETYEFLSHQENLGLFQITKAICMRTGQVISGIEKTFEGLAKIVEDNPSISTMVAASDVFDDLNLGEAVWPRPIKVIRDEGAFSKGMVGFYPPSHLAGSVYFLQDASTDVIHLAKGVNIKQYEVLGIGIDDIKNMWMGEFQ